MHDPEVQRVMMENMKKLGFGPGMGGGGFMWYLSAVPYEY
jgi:hypothetical protein